MPITAITVKAPVAMRDQPLPLLEREVLGDVESVGGV
jgi:hypothetical protein